jgi:hypothetical protein
MAPQEHLWVPVSTRSGYAAPFLEGYAQWDGEVWNVVEAGSQDGAQARVMDDALTVHTHVRITKLCEGWEVLPQRAHSRGFVILQSTARDKLKAILHALSIHNAVEPDRMEQLRERVKVELQQRDKYETAKGWVRATKEERDGEPHAGYMVCVERNAIARWYFVEAETPIAAQQVWTDMPAKARAEAQVHHAIWYRLQPSNAADMQTLTESELRAFMVNSKALHEASFSGLNTVPLAAAELTRRETPAKEPEQLPLKIETARPVLKVERWCPVVCSLGNRFLQQAPDGSWTQGMDRTQSMAQHLYDAEGEANWCVRNVDPKEYEFRPVSAEDARTLTEGELRAVLLTDIHHAERARTVARNELARRKEVEAEARLATPGTMDWPKGAKPEDQPDLKTTLPLGTATPSPASEERPQATPERGVKWDGKKARWSLFPWDALQSILAVLESGAAKYLPDNWLKVENARQRYFDAVMRHLTDWWRGERFDKEWGYPHLAHAACCILFLLAMELRGMFDPPTQPTPAEPDAATPEKAPGA